MSRFTKRDRYGHAYTNETIYDRGMASKDGKTYEKHYFENGTSAYDGKPIDRLCELEDKIEHGEMVEVVRCKDCIYSDDCICVVCEEGETVVCKRMLRHFPKEHYCGFGERRE